MSEMWIGGFDLKDAHTLLARDYKGIANGSNGVLIDCDKTFTDLSYKQFNNTDVARCITARYTASPNSHTCEGSGVLISTEASVDNDEPKIIDAYNRRVLKDGIVGTLTANGNTSIMHCGTFLAADYNDSNIQTDSNSPKVIGGVGEKTFGKQYPQGNIIYDVGHVSPALQANNGNASKGSIIIGGKNIRIRRLTPKECWRLQGWGFRKEDGSWDDTAFEKAKASGVSDSQLYKQAGNGCSANVVMAIGLTLKEIENSFS